MANSQDILLTYRTDTGEVTKSLDEIVSGLSEVDKKLDDSAKKTSKVGKGLRAAGRLGAAGFKALGTAIAATGIGALVGILAGLAAKMAENKKIAEAFEVVVSAVGAAFNILVQRIEPFAGAVVEAFSNPVESIKKLGDAIKNNIQTRIEGLLEFIPAIGKAIKLVFEGEWEEAGKVAADAAGKVVLGVEDITDKVSEAADAVTAFAADYQEEVTKAVAASTSLTKEQQALRDQQRELNVEYAEARAEIEQLKQKRDDERLSIEERIAAAERAAELDQQFAQERMDIANAEVALIQQEIALQGETEERLDRLAEARIAAAEAAESSAAVQTELMTSIYGLNQEAIAIEEERLAKEQEAAEERKRLLDEEAKLKEENAKKEIEDNRAVLDDRLAYANASLDALRQLNEAFAGASQNEQARTLNRSKSICIEHASQTQAAAPAAAITPALGGFGIPAGLPGAALAALTGAAQVATIARSQFGGGGGGSTPSAPSRTVSEPAPTTPQLDLGFLGGGAGQTGFRTYVVSSEVSNAQQANQRINDQATLVG